MLTRCDGIGRHDGLKIRWAIRAGSNPATETKAEC